MLCTCYVIEYRNVMYERRTFRLFDVLILRHLGITLSSFKAAVVLKLR